MTAAQTARANADAAVARSLAAIRASKAAHRVRTNAGRRHSQKDLDNMTAAHDALVQAGATHGDNPTAQDAGASPQHQQLLDAAHDAIAAAAPDTCDYADDPMTEGARATDPSSADNLRNNAVFSNPPDPYELALQKRSAANRAPTGADIRAAITPDLDSDYQPFGHAPDGHRIAVALRTALANPDAQPASADLPRDAAGTPNPYSAEAIAAYQRARGM